MIASTRRLAVGTSPAARAFDLRSTARHRQKQRLLHRQPYSLHCPASGLATAQPPPTPERCVGARASGEAPAPKRTLPDPPKPPMKKSGFRYWQAWALV
jgi:hypothetical protein